MPTQPLSPQDEYILDKILMDITSLHWKQALSRFAEMSVLDASATQLKRLALNMSMAQKKHAILYNQLTLCIEQGKLNLHYKPMSASQGEWETIAHETPTGTVLDHPMQSPLAQAKRRIAEFEPAFAKDDPLAVIGIEDGHLLTGLAKRNPCFDDGRATAIFVIEPSAERVLACFQLHDWSSSSSPLGRAAFEWIVGQDWHFELKNRLQQDPMLPPPTHVLTPSKEDRKTLLGVTAEALTLRANRAADQFNQFKARKEVCSKRAVGKLLVENPKRMPRPPKVAVIGNRFSKASMNIAPDIARGLANIGWKVAVIIENNERQRLTQQVIQDRLAAFDPNLIVCIHQPLTAAPGTLEPNTPTLHFGPVPETITGKESFVHATLANPLSLAHLAVGDRAIVLPNIMSQISLPTALRDKTPHLVVYGGAPELPTKMLQKAIETCHNSAASRLTERVGHALMDHYEKGRSLATLGQLESLIEHCAGKDGSDKSRAECLDKLWVINRALYALHSVHWAVKACKNVGAQLSLYGTGWESHPKLESFHANPKKDKEHAIKLLQGATACMHAHPGFCLNADLLDWIAEGSFVLVREHPLNRALPDLAAFMAANTPNAKDMREATAIVGALKNDDLKAQLQTLAEAVSKALPKSSPDPLVLVRSCARSGVLGGQMQSIPRLNEVGFNDPEQLGNQLKHWHDRPEERENLVREQQEALHGRLAIEPTLMRAIYLLARRFVANA